MPALAAETSDHDTTIVTANRRLARAVRASLDRARVHAGCPVWESPDVVPYTAWIERWWEQSPASRPARAVLSTEQEQAVWEQVIADDLPGGGGWPGLRVSAAGQEARRAWALLTEWRVSDSAFDGPVPVDVRAFRRWVRRARERCADEGWMTASGAAEVLADHGEAVASTGTGRVVFLGFERLSPLQERLLARLRDGGVQAGVHPPEPCRGRVSRVACPDREAELETAARWARSLLDRGESGSLGVVVPELDECRGRVEAVFDAYLRPGAAIPGASVGASPYNISLGKSLTTYPVVRDALAGIALARKRIERDLVCRLLRSPFIGGGMEETFARARLDAKLRARGELLLGLDAFRGHAARAPLPDLSARLGRARTRLGEVPESQSAHGWSETFSAALEILDWPGERPLTSAEFQTVQAFRELLATFSSLSAILGGLGAESAVARLRRLARERVFQPQGSPAPVQILGTLESIGLDFEHLWLLGLHEAAWPTPARPNAFIPVSLQCRLGMPRAEARLELDFCRRVTRRWRGAARTVTASFPTRAGDQPMQPSPLIAAWPARGGLGRELSGVGVWRDRIRDQAPALEYRSDARGPDFDDGPVVTGGSRVLQDQAACPFRSFAVHRLGAAGAPDAVSALDAGVRGELVHRALAHLWRGLRSRDRLLALSLAEREASILDAVERALEEETRRRPGALGGRLRALERTRLGALLDEWLRLESERSPFEVTALEQESEVLIGSLRLRVRPDRIDRLPDGRRVLIDYKTGRGSISDWFGDRLRDPQLPLYVLAGEHAGGQDEGFAAAALAVLRRGKVQYLGLADEDGLAPGVSRPRSSRTPAARSAGEWVEVKRRWQVVLERLAREWAQGDARVDPALGPRTCRACVVQPLCRIREHAGALAAWADD